MVIVAMRVPVARDGQLAGGSEIVFHQLGRGLRLVILEKPMVAGDWLGAIVEVTDVVGIDDRTPWPI